MEYLRRSNERGATELGWLHSQHSFSFGDYYDPAHMGFGVLRVINDDRVEPGQGFGTHGHQDMEIISYVVAGELAHKDSLGNGSSIRPGDVQRMSAGTGVTHSEFNGSGDSPVHFLQIWLFPNEQGLSPGYGQKHFPEEQRRNRLVRIVSGQGREEAIGINQDVELFSSLLDAGQTVTYAPASTPASDRSLWIQVASGTIDVNGKRLQAGDGLGITETEPLTIRGGENANFLLFDLPGLPRH